VISIDKWIGFNLLQLEAMYIFKFINNNKGQSWRHKSIIHTMWHEHGWFHYNTFISHETFIVLTIGIWLVTQINSHSGDALTPFENLKSQVIPWKTIENLKSQVIPWLNNNSYIYNNSSTIVWIYQTNSFMHINPSKYLLSL